MISQTGNEDAGPILKYLRRKRGLSFIELMVTVAVLSSGIILIYRAFFISLSYLDHVVCRLYAMHCLENAIVNMQMETEQNKGILFREHVQNRTIKLGNKTIDFHCPVKVSNVENLDHIFRVEVSCRWKEGSRDIQLSQTEFITDYRL